ncbi:MAG: (d)CMP kinase [Peptococcaceae bacterium]|nr:(d)CMP kinase [Peptococcaceae bacterium]
MVSRINIAIDGPAGAGKSTVAKMVARELGLTYIDTGAMYRALTVQAMRDRIDLNDEAALAGLAVRTSIIFDEDGRVLLNGEDVTEAIRRPEVSRCVSLVAKVPGVRKRLVELQRRMAAGGKGVVMEGRDIGTVVLPDAPVKVFLTASPGERARRRREELAAKGIIIDRHKMEEELNERDRIDSSREVDPLAPAPGARIIDCSNLEPGQVMQIIVDAALREGS